MMFFGIKTHTKCHDGNKTSNCSTLPLIKHHSSQSNNFRPHSTVTCMDITCHSYTNQMSSFTCQISFLHPSNIILSHVKHHSCTNHESIINISNAIPPHIKHYLSKHQMSLLHVLRALKIIF